MSDEFSDAIVRAIDMGYVLHIANTAEALGLRGDGISGVFIEANPPTGERLAKFIPADRDFLDAFVRSVQSLKVPEIGVSLAPQSRESAFTGNSATAPVDFAGLAADWRAIVTTFLTQGFDEMSEKEETEMSESKGFGFAHFDCVHCGESLEHPGYVGVCQCKCGLRYTYNEGMTMEEDSILLLAQRWPRPIPVSERLPEVGTEALWFISGLTTFWRVDRSDLVEGEDGDLLRSKMGSWLQLTLEADGWIRRHGTQMEVASASHWLPLPPDPPKPQRPNLKSFFEQREAAVLNAILGDGTPKE